MKKSISLLVVALVWTLSPTAFAEPAFPLSPTRPGLTGTWVLEERTRPSVGLTDRCDRTHGLRYNEPMFGFDRLHIRPAGEAEVHRSMGNVGDRILEIPYTVTWVHRHGWGTSQDHPDGTEVYRYCAIDDMEFEMAGTLRYNLTAGGANWRFSANGPVVGESTYPHGQSAGLSEFYDQVDLNITSYLYDDVWGDAINLQATFSDGSEGANGAPMVCDFSLSLPAEEYDITRCTPSKPGLLRFVRTDQLPDPLPRGTLSGVLHQLSPDEQTETDEPITEATVTAYLHGEPVRDRMADETMADYERYLVEDVRATRVAELRHEDPEGRFAFDVIPTLKPTSNAVTRALYTLVIRNARTFETEFGGEYYVYFQDHAATNLLPDENPDREIHIASVPAIGVKQTLADDLSALAPNNYAPIESNVTTYLEDFRDGTRMLTPTATEGIRRAVWAERAVLMGARYAKEYLTLALQTYGGLVEDIIKLALSQSRQVDGEVSERLGNLREAQVASLRDRGWKGIRDADVPQLQANVFDVMSESRNALMEYVVGWLKLGFKYGVVNPLSKILTDPEEKEMLSIAADGINAVLDGLGKGDLQSAASVVVDRLIQLLAEPLFDGPVSYASLTSPLLQDAYDGMSSWSVAEIEEYEFDRDEAVAHLERMNDIVGATQVVIDYLSGFGAGLDASADAFGVLSSIPVFATAEKVTQIVKVLTNANVLFHALKLVALDLPLQTTQAVGDAMDETNDVPLADGRRAGTPVPIEPAHAEALHSALQPGAFSAVADALWDDDIPAALDATADRSPVGMIGRLHQVRRAFRRFHAQLQAANVDDDKLEEFMDGFTAEYQETMLLARELMQQLSLLYVRMLSDEFSGPDDPAWISERALLGNAIYDIQHRFRALDSQVTDIDDYLADVDTFPAIAVEDLTVASPEGRSVMSAGQTFEVTATVRNLSTTSVAGLSGRLDIAAPDGVVELSGPAEQTVGTLDAFDESGGGGDRSELTWTVTYTGDPAAGNSATLAVEVLENGGAPETFFGFEDTTFLQPDPRVADVDSDGLLDQYERSVGLDPGVDDSAEDPDGDGLASFDEWSRGTDPTAADTDGDGISDGDELSGDNGFVTDPLAADTDGDGADDAADPAPVDGSSQNASGPLLGEPVVEVDRQTVVLSYDEPVAVVNVSNGGEGNLVWSAFSPDEGIALAGVGPVDAHAGAGSFTVSLPGWFDWGTRLFELEQSPTGGLSTTIHVVDLYGTVPDVQEIEVVVGSPPAAGEDMGAGPTDMGTGGDLGSMGDAARSDAAGSDAGFIDGPAGGSESSGCCRVVAAKPSGARVPLMVLLLFGALIARRR